MKHILLFVSFVLLTSPLFAQVRLSGRVVDPDGKPVQGAEVSLSSERVPQVAPVKTDRRGRWVTLIPVGGPWSVDIAKEGYVTFRGSVVVSETSRMPPLESTMQPLRVAVEPKQEVPASATVPPEAVAAVESGERFLRRAGGNATPEDLAALGLAPDAAAPTAEERAELYRQAIVEFEKAHQLLPEHVEIKKVLARSYYASGQLEPAVTLLEDVLEAEPANAGIALLLVNLLAEQGKLEKARSVLDALPTGALTDPTAVVNVAILFLNRGDAEEAHRYAERAIAVDPLRGESYYYRGIAALQMGNTDEAKADFKKVVELAPESTEAADSKDLLGQMK